MTTTTPRRQTHHGVGTSTTPHDLSPQLQAIVISSLVFAAAIFGFFYAWVCSTMWGLDAADPRVAIAAMQSMNASVRNAVFFPAFFLTPVVIAAAGVALQRDGRRAAARRFFAGAGVYFVGGLVLTMAINVPMNEDLALVTVPESLEAAATIWQDYSGRWQLANTIRTVISGVTVVLVGLGLTSLHRR